MSILDRAEWLHALFIKSNGDDKWIEVTAASRKVAAHVLEKEDRHVGQ